MSARLVYVMGPSGAGKDSLLGWLQAYAPDALPLHFARRTITREVRDGDEQHHSIGAAAFERLCEAQAFAMEWSANGLRYGIHHDELSPMHRGQYVIVNGSRGYLPDALGRFPGMTVIHVTASIDTLRARLRSRGRETPEMVEARVMRALAFEAPPGAIEIRNDGTLDQAGAQLLAALEALATSAR